jgi:hypothetical protein
MSDEIRDVQALQPQEKPSKTVARFKPGGLGGPDRLRHSFRQKMLLALRRN